jgi:AcrR family transcriptional regulator
MPRTSAERTRRQILEAAYECFYQRGFARSSVDDIAAMAKVTKRTLYNHFESKDSMLAAVLETQRELSVSRIQKYQERYSGNGQRFVSVLFEELRKWSEKPRWAGAGITRLALELADLPGHPARIVARRHKAEAQDWLASMLQRAGTRRAAGKARELQLLIEGAGVLMLISGDRSYADTAAALAKRVLSANGMDRLLPPRG